MFVLGNVEWYAGGMFERTRHLLWYVFVFLLPWQTVWIVRELFVGGEKWQYATIGIYASDISLFLSALFFFCFARKEIWRAMRGDRMLLVLVMFFAWTLSSSLWAIDAELAFLSTWRVFLMILACVLVRYGEFSIRRTLFVFLVSMSFQAMLALSQWMSQYVFSFGLLGIAEHNPAQWGSSVLKTESGRFLRAYGGFEHPNIFGGALVFFTIFGVWFLTLVKRLRFKIIFFSMMILSSFALVFTFSRSAWMAFGMGMSSIITLGLACNFFGFSSHEKSMSRVQWKAILPFVIVCVLSFFIGFFLVHDIATSRFSEEVLTRDGSLSNRVVYMKQAFVAIREYPIFGVGGGNFTAFTQFRFPEKYRFIDDFQPVHAVPILVFAELGVVGFILFSLLFVFGFVRMWQEKNIFSGTILFALLPLLFLDHWLWSGHFGMIFFGFLLGMCGVSSRISQHPTQEE